MKQIKRIPIKCHTWTEAGCMAKIVLVGVLSAKLTQFSWCGGGEWPDHMGSPVLQEPENQNSSISRLPHSLFKKSHNQEPWDKFCEIT